MCFSGHNSGTPGAISTKLGTHIAICMCKNLMYIYLSSISIKMDICVCPGITLERLERFRPNLVHRVLYVCVRILYISICLSSISIHMDVCVRACVCVFEHNSGTPGVISTKLGTHTAICMCKNVIYIYLWIYLLYL
jgi:hypothetical protein